MQKIVCLFLLCDQTDFKEIESGNGHYEYSHEIGTSVCKTANLRKCNKNTQAFLPKLLALFTGYKCESFNRVRVNFDIPYP